MYFFNMQATGAIGRKQFIGLHSCNEIHLYANVQIRRERARRLHATWLVPTSKQCRKITPPSHQRMDYIVQIIYVYLAR